MNLQKRFLIATALVTIVFGGHFLFSGSANAQDRGTYSCAWSQFAIPPCIVHPASNCKPGFVPGDACESLQFPNSTACQELVDIPCVPENPEAVGYKCETTGQCVECDPNEAGGENCEFLKEGENNPLEDCKAVCIPGTPLTYGCVDGECTPVVNGQFSGLTQCLQYCTESFTSPRDIAFLVSEHCDGRGFVNTAIGCIPFKLFGDLARFFFSWSLSIGGGIALLIIVISTYMFMTSGGNPDKLNSSKALFFSAIGGLLLILLTVFLLITVEYDVLGLFVK